MAATVEARAARFADWPADRRWNFFVLGADIAVFSLGLSISSAYTVLPLFVSHLTTSNVVVALIPAIRALGQFGPQLLVAPLVERRRHLLPFILRTTILERVPYLLLALGTLLLVHRSAGVLLALFFLMLFLALLGSGLSSPPWLDMIARAIPPTWTGRFFGLWVGVGGIMGIGGAAIAAAVLARVSWPLNFAVCFALTFVTFIVSFVLLALGREPARPMPPVPARLRGRAAAQRRDAVRRDAVRRDAVRRDAVRRAGGPRRQLDALGDTLRKETGALWELLREDGGLRRLIASNGMAGIATMAGGLFAVAALRRGGLSDAQVGVESTVLFLGSTAGYFLWGAIGDHLGHRAVLVWGSVCAGASALLALGAHGFVSYALVFLLLGLNVSAVGLASFTFIIEFGPRERRPTYIALAAVAYAPFAVGAPLLGGWLADRWGYTPVFILAAITALAAAAAYQFTVPNPRHRQRATAATHGLGG